MQKLDLFRFFQILWKFTFRYSIDVVIIIKPGNIELFKSEVVFKNYLFISFQDFFPISKLLLFHWNSSHIFSTTMLQADFWQLKWNRPFRFFSPSLNLSCKVCAFKSNAWSNFSIHYSNQLALTGERAKKINIFLVSHWTSSNMTNWDIFKCRYSVLVTHSVLYQSEMSVKEHVFGKYKL